MVIKASLSLIGTLGAILVNLFWVCPLRRFGAFVDCLGLSLCGLLWGLASVGIVVALGWQVDMGCFVALLFTSLSC